MAIRNYYNKKLIVRRLKTISGDKKVMISTGTVEAYMQETTEQDSSAGLYAVYGATHACWMDISENIKEGDQISISDELYSVVGVINEGENIAENEHKKVLLKKYTS